MRRRHGSAMACLLAGSILAGGCASPSDRHFDGNSTADVFVAPGQQAISKIALLPFKAPTELIGSSVSDLLITELLRTGKYEVLERSQLSKVLGEAELSLSGLSDSKAAEVGAMVGADGIVLGTVDEYGTVAYRGFAYPTVGISARLIDCKSGKVMWSVSQAGRARSKDVTLPQHARAIVHQMMSALYQNWK